MAALIAHYSTAQIVNITKTFRNKSNNFMKGNLFSEVRNSLAGQEFASPPHLSPSPLTKFIHVFTASRPMSQTYLNLSA
jgi:hypothetical protein